MKLSEISARFRANFGAWSKFGAAHQINQCAGQDVCGACTGLMSTFRCLFLKCANTYPRKKEGVCQIDEAVAGVKQGEQWCFFTDDGQHVRFTANPDDPGVQVDCLLESEYKTDCRQLMRLFGHRQISQTPHHHHESAKGRKNFGRQFMKG